MKVRTVVRWFSVALVAVAASALAAHLTNIPHSNCADAPTLDLAPRCWNPDAVRFEAQSDATLTREKFL